jgi:hypothetical protein
VTLISTLSVGWWTLRHNDVRRRRIPVYPRGVRRHVVSAAAAALACLAGAGCGSSSGPASATHTTAAAVRAPATPRPATGAAPWPAPAHPLARARAAGLVPERREQLRYHVHAHLDVYLDGHELTVPAGLGIDITDPGVHSGKLADGSTAYGGISLCRRPCISPLHTHDVSGVLHTESSTATPNQLGQLFLEWGVRLTPRCVGGYCRPAARIAVYVDGRPYHGDPRRIGLRDQREIAVVIGTPPQQIPATFAQGLVG